MLNDEVIGEKAFAVENPDLQAVAFISRDPQLGEAGHFFGSVSVYDFSTPKPVSGPCVAACQMAYSQFVTYLCRRAFLKLLTQQHEYWPEFHFVEPSAECV